MKYASTPIQFDCGAMLETVDICGLTPADIGTVMLAWWRWAATGEENLPEDRLLRILYMQFCQQTRNERQRHSRCVANGKSGGRPRKDASKT